MRNSCQEDNTLFGCRLALPLLITNQFGFLVTVISYLHYHDMVLSTPARRHFWVAPAKGYGSRKGLKGKAVMTTAYVFRAPHRDRVPGIVLEALKTTQGTTRRPAWLWYPEDGTIHHVAFVAHIPYLGGDYNPQGGSSKVPSLQQVQTIWKVINTTDLSDITSDNLASSMGSKNASVDVFAVGFVVSLPFHHVEGDANLSFLVCTAEFIHVRHTDKGNLKTVLTNCC